MLPALTAGEHYDMFLVNLSISVAEVPLVFFSAYARPACVEEHWESEQNYDQIRAQCWYMAASASMKRKKKKNNPEEKGTHVCTHDTTFSMLSQVQKITSMWEHMVTGSLDQPQGSTKTSGAAKK